MQKKTFSFSKRSVDYFFNAGIKDLKHLVHPNTGVIITDENIFALHKKIFKGWNTIVLKAGEEYKVQATVDSVIDQLISLKADRNTTLVGVGGGVITDLTGYVASVFLRGISFGFVPTTLLAMVDAAIGGKNGIDVGLYKNMVGTINQPKFLLYDIALLKTLPDAEWRNGFAEIIKHAAIKDEGMFKELEGGSLKKIRSSKIMLQKLVHKNALIKTKVVQADEYEMNERRLLNFGHTLGHALEKQYNLMHGEAVAIGMCYAAELSQQIAKFKDAERIIKVVDKYGLPTDAGYNKKKVFEVLINDKKREGNEVNFILLEKIGKASVKKIELEKIYKLL